MMTLADIAKLRLDAENVLTWQAPQGDVGDVLMFHHLQRFAKAVLDLTVPKTAQPRKTKQQMRDEAYLRTTGGLPGQVTIEEGIAAAEEERAVPPAAPAFKLDPGHLLRRDTFCPACSRVLPLAHGWAYSKDGDPTVQCPQCGARFAVPPREHEEYRHMVREHYASLKQNPLPKKTRGPRTRGAG